MKNRLKKAVLLTTRNMAHNAGFMSLYYWSEIELHQFRDVYVMPNFYYRCLYYSCMWMVEHRKLKKLAILAIHTIPYHIRFQMA